MAHGAVKDLQCKPGETCVVEIPYDVNVPADKEIIITFKLKVKDKTAWANRAHVIAAQQFRLTPDVAANCPSVADPTYVQQNHIALPAISEKGKLKVKGNSVEGKNFSIKFDTDGTIAEWTYEGKQIVMPSAGPDFNGFRRIANDNDNKDSIEGDEDVERVNVLIVAQDRVQLSNIVNAARTAIRDYLGGDAFDTYGIADYSVSASAVMGDWTVPCTYQSLNYTIYTNIQN